VRITVATIGSRGDVQPCVALGAALARAGHTVRIATCEPFRAMVVASNLEFASLGGHIKEIVGDEGRAELLASRGDLRRTFRTIRRFLRPMIEEGLDRMPAALDGSEMVIAQMLAMGAYHHAERHRIPFFEAQVLPLFPTGAFAHPGAPVTTPRGAPSFLGYLAAEQLFWQAFRSSINEYRQGILGLAPAPFFGPHALRVKRRAQVLMGVSPAVIPEVRDWPAQVAATGFWFLDPPGDYQPSPRLVDFLESGEPPVYVGFGSMTVEDPERVTRMILTAVRKAKKRAILSAGWGGLLPTSDTEDVLFDDEAPHSWLFPRTSAVVHHGGPGTAAAALRAGIPQLAAPFLADQPFWGHRIEVLGVGPRAVPFPALTAENLAVALGVMSDPAMQRRAREMGNVIRAERGADAAVEALHRRIGLS
jgi:sterol 3beta-glucosyltransferase